MAHNKLHDLDSTIDHTGISGAVGNFMALDANGLPVDSTYTSSDFSTSGHNHDHGTLIGLGDDDHPQYHNDARGDARYYTQSQVNTISGVLSAEIDSDISTHAANADAHHAELHTIASHSDTNATGAQLNTLTDGSDADSLHYHNFSSISGTLDHSNLSGLTDDDHTQYLLADGSRALTSDWGYGSSTVSGTGDMIVGEFSMKVYSQAAEPTLSADNRLAMWIDTDDSNKVFLLFRRGSGDNVSVELA